MPVQLANAKPSKCLDACHADPWQRSFEVALKLVNHEGIRKGGRDLGGRFALHPRLGCRCLGSTP
jgi:hypothetical protein